MQLISFLAPFSALWALGLGDPVTRNLTSCYMPINVTRAAGSPPGKPEKPPRVFLNAKCPANDTTDVVSMIDLDMCLVAHDHDIYGQPWGGWSGSCWNFKMSDENPTVLTAKCGHVKDRAAYDLALSIVVQDGNLHCFDLDGCYKNADPDKWDFYGNCTTYQLGDGFMKLHERVD